MSDGVGALGGDEHVLGLRAVWSSRDGARIRGKVDYVIRTRYG